MYRTNQPGTIRGRLLAAAAMGALALAGIGVACSDDEPSAEEIAEVEDLVTTLFASGPEEADFMLAHMTDNLFEKNFFTTREDCAADLEECLGEPTPLVSVTETEIDGDEATTIGEADFGTMELLLVREDDVWKLDLMQAVSDDVPDGTEEVALSLVDFGFEFDAGDIPSDGDFAFNVTNDGAQPHEVLVFPIPDEGDIGEAMENSEGPPAGIKVFVQADQEVDMAFNGPLEPGRYALVCFFPDANDPEGTPHAEKGMLAEFTID